MARIYLSPPHMGPEERQLLLEAFDSNWIAPLGPMVDAFENEFASYVGAQHAAALSSGTGAIHLALLLLGVGANDRVYVPSLTFSGSANPVAYCGAEPVFLDVERRTWNMCPMVLAEALEEDARKGTLPKAVMVVHLYGQAAEMDEIVPLCKKYGVPIIEDAAEAAGTLYRGRHVGNDSEFGIFSFNGNKIMSTSGGGMLVGSNPELIQRARFLATQAREPAAHYQHEVIGYNYRMSNLLAAVGRGQLRVLEDRVAARRTNFNDYQEQLGALPGLSFPIEPEGDRATHWLTVMQVDQDVFGASPEDIRLALEEQDIEARPLWKPMHMQPVFRDCQTFGCEVSEDLFANGICLPSGSALAADDRQRVIESVAAVAKAFS
ncbi:MAG: aminotransferase class I/II-fold pyridoxal phosphate-dependent enzyme [Planctomycetes bacterium]|nr:aminotransferase class I/II-fold pyridoxal phosphate-dependent enzyme [Planctomycetota bacterium]